MIESQVSRLLKQPRKPAASNYSVAELENQFSHLTAIERVYLSFPVQFLLKNNFLKGKILDFGCGLGNDVKLLRQKGFDITGYDPYHFPDYPTDKFDTIICSYVLNVLFPEEQANVLMEVSHLLKPFTQGLFYGILTFFLLDMGLVAAKRIKDLQKTGIFLISFAILIPIVNACIGLLIAKFIGMAQGDALLFAVLCASASYIAFLLSPNLCRTRSSYK